MGRKSRFASKALEFAYDRYVGDDKAKAEAFEAGKGMGSRAWGQTEFQVNLK